MNLARFEKLLVDKLNFLGIPPSRMKVTGEEMNFNIDGRTPVTLRISEYDADFDVLIQIGSRRQSVSAWNSQVKESAALTADKIKLLCSVNRRNASYRSIRMASGVFGSGYRLRDRSASQGLTSKQAGIIANSLRPLIQTEGRTAANITGVIKRVTGLMKHLSRQPRAWQKFTEMVGAGKETLNAIGLGKLIWEWAVKGKKLIKDLVKKVTETFPMSLYFVPKNKVPTLTDLLNLILEKAPDSIRGALSKVNEKVLLPLSDALDKYLPTLQRPLIAALFAWVWINVTEISWDVQDLLRGFTGSMNLAELFSTLPESGIGLIFAMFGVGYHLLPVMVAARILWLVGNHFLEWKNGSLIVRWERLGVLGEKDIAVAIR